MSQTYTSSAEAERHADQARRDLTATLDTLAGNLSPRRLAGEAVAATRSATPDWLLRFWESARSPAALGLVGATAASIAVTLARRRRHR